MSYGTQRMLKYYTSDDSPYHHSLENPSKNANKEKAMLGIWADDEVYPTAPTSNSKSGFKPIQFVSKGFYNIEKGELDDDKETDEHKNTNLNRFRVPQDTRPIKLGSWEKNTKGIASKILSKMGWKGKGLGKNEQGLVSPIETKVRPERVGLREEDLSSSNKTFPKKSTNKVAIEDLDDATFLTLTKRQRKSRQYANMTRDIENDEQMIIDMRGPEKKIYTSMDQVNTNNFEEVDINELQIIQLEQRKKFINQSKMRLLKEEERHRAELASTNSRINRFSLLSNLIEQSVDLSKLPDNLTDLIDNIGILKADFQEEFQMFSLESLIFHLIFPIIQTNIENWNPLEAPSYLIPSIKSLRDILHHENVEDEVIDDPFGIRIGKVAKKLDSFNRLIYELIIPKVQSAIEVWDPRNPDVCIDLIEAWMYVMPQKAVDHLLYGLVLRKLDAQVSEWNPQKDTLPIHVWIHPWLPLLGDSIKDLFEPIRKKFEKTLNNWTVSDSSAISLLCPWFDIFDKKSWNRLMARSIVPKLEHALKQFVIDPSNQNMETWTNIMKWNNKIPTDAFCKILEREFFTKWFRILGMWILSDDADYEEISQWYLVWKKQFPPELLYAPRIKSQFRRALILMNNVVSGKVPKLNEFIPHQNN